MTEQSCPHYFPIIIHILRNEKLVAAAVQFSSGKCVVHWEGECRSVVVWDSLDDLKKVHGHPGTQFVLYESATKTEDSN